jgi:hypothetical protein
MDHNFPIAEADLTTARARMTLLGTDNPGPVWAWQMQAWQAAELAPTRERARVKAQRGGGEWGQGDRGGVKRGLVRRDSCIRRSHTTLHSHQAGGTFSWAKFDAGVAIYGGVHGWHMDHHCLRAMANLTSISAAGAQGCRGAR